MRVSFRWLLVATVCTAVWIPMIVVVVLFNDHSQSLIRKSTEERLPPTATRLGGIVHRSLDMAEKVAKMTAKDLTSGSLALVETEEGLQELRVRWNSVLETYRSTSSVQFLTDEASGSAGRLVGLVEFSGGEDLWWWTPANGSLEQWRVNATTLTPYLLEWSDPSVRNEYLPQVRRSVPSGKEECWMPIYTRTGSVWSSFTVKAYSPNQIPTAAAGAQRPVWGYAIVDLIIQDLEAVLTGVTIPKGFAMFVDSTTSTLLGTTSDTVPSFRVDGDNTYTILVNETTGNTVDERRVAAVNDLVTTPRCSILKFKNPKKIQ
eukprot:m51a1_g7295 hypothetical protein (318) ;mRNA; r:64345-72616